MVLTAGNNVLSMMRGDTQIFQFACTATPAAVRFYVRKRVDDTALVALTLAANPTQIVWAAGALSVTLLPANTDGQPVGNWFYDLEITSAAGGVTTTHWGVFRLTGDIATDAITSTPAAAGYLLTAAEDAALGAASSPSAGNPLMTDSAADALVAAHAALPYAHGNAGSAGIRVPVMGNWATAANAWADIKAATGWNIAGDWYDVTIYLYASYANPPRYGQLASLLVGCSAPTYGVGWLVAPTNGDTVYIVGAVPSLAA